MLSISRVNVTLWPFLTALLQLNIIANKSTEYGRFPSSVQLFLRKLISKIETKTSEMGLSLQYVPSNIMKLCSQFSRSHMILLWFRNKTIIQCL